MYLLTSRQLYSNREPRLPGGSRQSGARFARALPDGGRYLLVDRSFDTGPSQRAALAQSLFQSSLIDPDHDLPTMEQIYSDLRAVGLEPMEFVEGEDPKTLARLLTGHCIVWFEMVEVQPSGSKPQE